MEERRSQPQSARNSNTIPPEKKTKAYSSPPPTPRTPHQEGGSFAFDSAKKRTVININKVNSSDGQSKKSSRIRKSPGTHVDVKHPPSINRRIPPSLTIDTTMASNSQPTSVINTEGGNGSLTAIAIQIVVPFVQRIRKFFTVRKCIIVILMMSFSSMTWTTIYMTSQMSMYGEGYGLGGDEMSVNANENVSQSADMEDDDDVNDGMVPTTLRTNAAKTRNMRQQTPNTKQKIEHQEAIIIIGSQGTGFHSVEQDLIQWSKDYSIRPYTYALPNIPRTKYNNSQGFIPLLDALATQVVSAPRGFPTYNRTKSNLSAFFIEEFRQGFNAQWIQNKNIILGSDQFHYIMDHDQTGSDNNSNHANKRKIEQFVEEFVGLMPWNDERYHLSGSNDRATALLLYRTSRLQYVKSLWSSTSSPLSPSNSNKTFVEWMLSSSRPQSQHLDPALIIADKLHQAGINIAVVDVDHVVVEMKLNLSHYLACEFFRLTCGDDGKLSLGNSGNTNANSTVKATELEYHDSSDTDLSVSPTKLNELEHILIEHDCCIDFWKDENVHFIPATSALKKRRYNCKCTNSNGEDLRKEMHHKLERLLKQG